MRRALRAVAVLALAACAPRLAPLTGAPAPARLPRAILPAGSRQVVFEWQLQDPEFTGKGDGVARVTAPDSARLDFFIAGGMASGAAILIGDSLVAPGPELIKSLVPPPPLLWASLGRLAVPALPDTVVRVDGLTLRADIGQPVAWRATFRGDTLERLEHVRRGRVAEWLARIDASHVRYRNEEARRQLDLTVRRTEPIPDFDASIWRLP